MNNTANIRYTQRQMFIATPFDAAFVAELKSTVKSKKWDPRKKEWVVDIKERPAVVGLVKRFFEAVEERDEVETLDEPARKSENMPVLGEISAEWLKGQNLEIWTDGACHGNPGPGGYGIIFCCNGQILAKSGGFRMTTNNRMEIMAAIVALETLKEKPKVVILYSDSQYLVDSITKGWAKKWKANNWKRNTKDKAINPDLWERLLRLCNLHSVDFRWVRGHAAQTENEWCDKLAQAAARQPDLPVDTGYSSDNGISAAGSGKPTPTPRLLR
jgi:ribonuclease HI